MRHVDEVNWICENPSHYNDFLFNHLHRELEGRLLVHYMHKSVKSHPWKSQLPRMYEDRFYTRKIGIDWTIIKRAISQKNNLFVIGGWFDKTAIIAIILLSVLRKPFLIWTDTPNLEKQRNFFFEKLRKAWIGFVFKHASVIMGTGKTALKALRSMQAPEVKLINMPYFIDTDVFVPSDLKEKTNDFVFLSSGRLDNSLKGYDLAIRALSEVNKRVPHLRFTYHLAGVGPDQEKLEQLVINEQLEDKVFFCGWLEISDLPDFFKKGDIFLHPALYEPYGVSVIEAMSCGMMVIGSEKTGAVVDRIDNGRNGFIHKDQDARDIADKICEAIADPRRFYEIRTKARSTALQWPIIKGVEIIKKAIDLCVAS